MEKMAKPQVHGILIYPWMPDGCPFQTAEDKPPCGAALYGVALAPGAEKYECRAFGCEHGHRCHVYEDALERTHEQYLQMSDKNKKKKGQ